MKAIQAIVAKNFLGDGTVAKGFFSGNGGARGLRDWLLAHAQGQGRIAVRGAQPSHWVLAEYLAATTRLPILGGLEHRNIHHADAHLFRRYRAGNPPGEELQRFFETYAVGWVVLGGEYGSLDYRQEYMELVATVAEHRIYRVRKPPSYFMPGSGRNGIPSIGSWLLRGENGAVTLTPGSRLGPYEITAPIGAGGMGGVFRAAIRDSTQTTTFDNPGPCVVTSFEALLATPFQDGVNAVCWARDLQGDFDEVVRAAVVGWRDADVPFSVDALSLIHISEPTRPY